MRMWITILALLTIAGCSRFMRSAPQPDPAAELEQIEQTADSLAERMADAISRRDAQALAWLYVEHPYAAYISDGLRIPQSRILDVVGESYSALERLDFDWERTQTLVLGRDAAAVTAWAIYTSVDTLGAARRERAVYSHVLVRESGRWKFLTTHKSAVERLPIPANEMRE